jgi:DsbC/DsbD-like thiol-disulfide interchange protein
MRVGARQAICGVWRGAALAAGLLGASALAEEAGYASAPGKSQSSARLLSAGPVQGGVYRAGVEIDLAPGTITYWRSPGEAGSPPVFDFSASENIAAVEIAYPAPKHIVEEGSVVAGYDARVVFPARVTPRDPKAPATLRLTLDYAACAKICLPAQAKLTLALPLSGASPYAEAIAAAERRVPRKASEAEAKALIAIERRGDTVWRVRYVGPGEASDLFSEIAEPLFLDSARAADGSGFDVKLVSMWGDAAKAPPSGAAATFTVITSQGAFETPLRLE